MGWRRRLLQGMREEEAKLIAQRESIDAELADLRGAMRQAEADIQKTGEPNEAPQASHAEPPPLDVQGHLYEALQDDSVRGLVCKVLASSGHPLSVYEIQEGARVKYETELSLTQLSRVVAEMIVNKELGQSDGLLYLAQVTKNGKR